MLIASLPEFAIFRLPSPQLVARFTNTLPALVPAPMSIPPPTLVPVVGEVLVDKVRFRLRLRSTLDMPSEAEPSGDGVSRTLAVRVGGDMDSSGAAGGDGDVTTGGLLLERAVAGATLGSEGDDPKENGGCLAEKAPEG